jgi:predicted DNA-binding transcriptional regulator AlpA
MDQLEQSLGKALRAKDVAEYLGMNVKHIRNHYKDLGGIRLGRHYRFFEKEIYYAIQKRTEVDSPSEKRKPEIGKGVFDKEGSQGLGNQDEAKASRRLERKDHHGLFE